MKQIPTQPDCQPSTLKGSSIIARNFFKKHGQLVLYEHGKRVLAYAKKAKMVNPDIISRRVAADSETRNLHYVLSQIILYHTLNAENIEKNLGAERPQPLRLASVYAELEAFSRIITLIRSENFNGDSVSRLAGLLDNGQPPKALLAILIDLAQTHADWATTGRFIAKENPAGSLFRHYASKEEADLTMRNIATFSESLFGQIAELFGYPSVSGDIFLQAYSVNHPAIYDFIVKFNESKQTKKRLNYTQAVMRKLKKIVSCTLKKLEVDAAIHLRVCKHLGKQMKKLAFKITAAEPGIIFPNGPDSKKQTERQKKAFAKLNLFELFNDLVAMRVVINKIKGKNMGELPEEEQEEISKNVKNMLVPIVKINSSLGGSPAIHEQFQDKDNGYKSWHLDIDPRDNNMVKYEIQIRTRRWHEIATEGEAAHYLYVNMGDNREFIHRIKRAYDKIVNKYKKPDAH